MGSNTNTQPWPLPFSETIVEPSRDAPTTTPGRAETTGEDGIDDLLQSLRSDAIEARTEPMVDPAAAARKADAVADALRGLREAQDRPWAPTPAAAAASDGARYAAHYGVHAIPRAAAPEDPAAKVILNVTLPPAEPPRPPSTPDAAEAIARHARTHVSLPRVAETVVRRRSPVPSAIPSKAPSRMLVALLALGIVLAGGGGIVWAGFRMWSPRPEPAAAAAPATTLPVAEPVSMRPAEPPPELTAAVAAAPATNDDALPGTAAPAPIAGATSVAPSRKVVPRPSAGRALLAAPSPVTAPAAAAKPAPPPARAPASPSRPVQETFE